MAYARSILLSVVFFSALSAAQGAALPSRSFQGRYYNNSNFTSLALTRTDAAINFNWGTGSPDRRISGNTFSVRWTGNWDFPRTGTYRFYVTADDGVRVVVNNNPVLNEWRTQTASFTKDAIISSGTWPVVVDYYENTGSAQISVRWEYIDGTAPTVSITRPRAGDTVTGPVPVEATAGDNVGVTRVSFYADGGLIGEDTTAPYAATWNTAGLTPKSYILTAVARDAAGNSATSTGVTVSVRDVTAPTVSITAPRAGDAVTGPLPVEATAGDNVGVARVSFYADGVLIGEDTTAPYAVTWNTAGLTPKSYALTAVARDAAGNITTSAAVTVSVGDGVAPTVSITGPRAGDTVTGSVPVEATAADNVGVTRVSFYADGGLIGEDTTAPYGVTWNTAGLAAKPYALTAVARDAAGNSTTSAAVTVSVRDTAAPTVSISGPMAEATVAGEEVVRVSATDNVGVAGVRFQVGGIDVGTEDTAEPFEFAWDTTRHAPGFHTLTVTARDAAGSQASASVRVTVRNIPRNAFLAEFYDNNDLTEFKAFRVDPLIDFDWITGSAHPSLLPDTFSVRWTGDWDIPETALYRINARGDDGIRVWVDNNLVLNGWELVGNYSAAVQVNAGLHRITVEYKENYGNAVARVMMGPAVPRNASLAQYYDNADLTVPKVVRVEEPPVGGLPINVRWGAGAPEGSLGVDTYSVRWTGDWDFPSAGAYRFRMTTPAGGIRVSVDGASVLDAWGSAAVNTTADRTLTAGSHRVLVEYRENVSSSAGATVRWDFLDFSSPTVSISAPAAGSTVGGPVTIRAAVQDDGGIAGVQFKVDGVNQGPEDVTFPYSASWPTAGLDGAHVLTAVARDKTGKTTMSAPVSVTVNSTSQAVATVAADFSQNLGAVPYIYGLGYHAIGHYGGVASIQALEREQRLGDVRMGIWWPLRFFNNLENGNVQQAYDALKTSGLAESAAQKIAMGARVTVEVARTPRFMSTCTSTQTVSGSGWKEYETCPPANLDDWAQLVGKVVEYFSKDHGLDVRYEIWNEPEFHVFWNGTDQQFFELYRASVRGAKSVQGVTISNVRVGGPTAANPYTDAWGVSAERGYLAKFIDWCDKNGIPELGLDYTPIDFLVWHQYGHHPSYAGDSARHVRRWLGESEHFSPESTELLIDEFNYQVEGFYTDERIDSEVNAAASVASVLDFHREGLSSFAFSSLGDYHPFIITQPGNVLVDKPEFFFGQGLFTEHGIRKPVYNGFRLLSMLQGNLAGAAVSGERAMLDAAAAQSGTSGFLLIANPSDNDTNTFYDVFSEELPSAADYMEYLLWLNQVGSAEEDLRQGVQEGVVDPDSLPLSAGIRRALRIAQEAAARARRSQHPLTVNLAATGLPSSSFLKVKRLEVGPNASNAYRAWVAAGGEGGGQAAIDAARAADGLTQTYSGTRPAGGTTYQETITVAPNSVILMQWFD